MDVLWLLARYRLATLPQLAARMATSEDFARRRLNRLEDAGHIASKHLAVGTVRIYGITDPGVAFLGTELAASTFAFGQLGHSLAVTDVGLTLEAEAHTVVTERQIRAFDTRAQQGGSPTAAPQFAVLVVAEGATKPSLKLPDLVIDNGGVAADIAVEMELTAKTSIGEHERLMRAYTSTTRYAKVIYYTRPELVRMLTVAAGRAKGSGASVDVLAWEPRFRMPTLATLTPARQATAS